MEELLKMLMEATKNGDAKVEVHKVNKDDFEKVIKNVGEDKISKDAQEIAHLNKLLYEAHIKEGFTSEEALALTVASIQ